MTTVSLEPAQLRALQGEAKRRARAEERKRPDVSALIREAIDAWLAVQRKK